MPAVTEKGLRQQVMLDLRREKKEYERKQKHIKARLQKKKDEITPRMESLVEEIRTMKINITQRFSRVIENFLANEERKIKAEKEVQQ